MAVPLCSRQSAVWRFVASIVRGWALVLRCADGMHVLGGVQYGCLSLWVEFGDVGDGRGGEFGLWVSRE